MWLPQVSQANGSLHSQMITQHEDVRAQMFKVLTPAQQTQLAALQAQMHSRGHGAWASAWSGRAARRRNSPRLQGSSAVQDRRRLRSSLGGGDPVFFQQRPCTLPWPTRCAVPTITR